MFGRSTPECPIDLETKKWIDSRWAWLIDQFGLARLRSAEVILPTADFFPDAYNNTPEDARLILDRVCVYMGIAPELVELSWYEDRNPVYDGEWRQGAAGTYHEEAGKFHVSIETGKLDDPLSLVATMAHELSHVHLLGHGRISADAEDHEPLTDLLTVYLGMGVFTANSVIRERYWHSGSVSGWSMGRQGYFSMPMFGYALARLAEARDEEEPEWASHLRADVHSPFVAACRFLADPEIASAAPVAVTTKAPQQRNLVSEIPESDDPVEDNAVIDVDGLLSRYASGEREFCGLDLRGFSLREADLRGCDLGGADLGDADLTRVILSESNLRDADLQHAVLCDAVLRGANLCGADLSGANLSGADLTNADIRGADLRGATLDRTILVATLRNRGTDFGDVKLANVVCDANLSHEVLRKVRFQRAGKCFAFVIVLGCMTFLGALIGSIPGKMLEHAFAQKEFATICPVVGAILLGIFSAWQLFRRLFRHRNDQG